MPHTIRQKPRRMPYNTEQSENAMTRKYMRSAEFNARQLWLDFIDAAGIALKTIAETIQNLRNWFKSWKAKPMKNKHDNLTMELDLWNKPPKPKYESWTWNNWDEMKSFGYSDKELIKRIAYDQETHRQWVKEHKEFKLQTCNNTKTA